MSCFASSRVSPTATHPGRSGTYAPTLLPVSSKMTRYSMPSLFFLQASLLQDTSKCTKRHIQAGFAGNGYGAGLRGMPKLAMTAASAYELPAIVFEHSDDFTDLHGA